VHCGAGEDARRQRADAFGNPERGVRLLRRGQDKCARRAEAAQFVRDLVPGSRTEPDPHRGTLGDEIALEIGHGLPSLPRTAATLDQRNSYLDRIWDEQHNLML
jgi:hypothetical protein